LALLLGCNDDHRHVSRRSSWFESGGRSASANLHPGGTFYTSDLLQHPDIGFVTYTMATKKWSRQQEATGARSAFSRIRQEFIESYQKGAISAWQDEAIAIAKGLHSRDVGAVRFNPEKVVVIIRDIGWDWKKKAAQPTHHDPRSMTQEEAKSGVKVGYLVLAKDLFNERMSIDELVSSAFRDEDPLHYELSQEVPLKCYDIIRHYEEFEKMADPVGSK
jgi:hypothetical protein